MTGESLTVLEVCRNLPLLGCSSNQENATGDDGLAAEGVSDIVAMNTVMLLKTNQ